MINIKVKEFKINLSDKVYTFRLDFNALMKFENKYKYEEDKDGNVISKESMVMFNEFLQGSNVYENMVKILSCACVEKEFEEEELATLLSFDFQTMKLMDEITFALVEGMINKDKKSKNEETSQKKNKEA
jgi:hypothetical protein